jgi:hypothetical protein
MRIFEENMIHDQKSKRLSYLPSKPRAAIDRRQLKGKEPIFSIAEALSIQPTQIHQGVSMALDYVERAFENLQIP